MQRRIGEGCRKRVIAFFGGNRSKLTKVICQDMITGRRGELRSGLNVVRDDVSELHTNTTIAFDHVAARLHNVRNATPSALSAEKVAQLRKDLSLLMKGRSDLSNQMEPRFSKLADHSAAVKQNSVSDHRPAPATQALRRRHEQVKKKKNLLDTDSDRSASSSFFSKSEEKNRSSRKAPHYSPFSPTHNGRKEDPQYPGVKGLRPSSSLYMSAV